MSDILDRLRADAGQLTTGALIEEREAAVAEIERLRRIVERLGGDARVGAESAHFDPALQGIATAVPLSASVALLRLDDVCALLDVSKATVCRWISDETFPSPLKLSEDDLRWRAEDVEAWRDTHDGANDFNW